MSDLVQPYNWDARGESLWSILSKLSAENTLSSVELRRCFYLDKSARTFGSASIRSCLSIEGIDRATILANTNLTEESLSWSIPAAFTLGEGDLSTKLRYCLDCFNEGFHSALFQIEAYTHCPWHDRPLRTECPNCDGWIDYEVGRAMSDSPYRCSCESPDHQPQVYANGRANQQMPRITWTRDFVGQIKRVERGLHGPSNSRLRLLTGGQVRHEQVPGLIRHLNHGRTRESYLRLHWTAAKQHNKSSIRYRLPLGKTDPHDKQLRRIREAWSNDSSRSKAAFFNSELLPDFDKAVADALSFIREQYLTNHATCWCLASPESKYQFAMGLTCMWRTAFELWREMYDPIVGRPPNNHAIECCWLIREWISIAERFLVKTERVWSRVKNPDVVARLSSRMTTDALVRHYALLVLRLEHRIAYAREPTYLHGPADLEQLIDTSYQPATYLLKLNANRDAVTMIIDDDQVNLAKMAKLANESDHHVDHLRTHAEDHL